MTITGAITIRWRLGEWMWIDAEIERRSLPTLK